MSRQRQTISNWRKQEVIQWIETVGEGVPTRGVAHCRPAGWSIGGASLRRWWRLREKIRNAAPYQARVAGGFSKPLSETLEDLLYPRSTRVKQLVDKHRHRLRLLTTRSRISCVASRYLYVVGQI
ncbi:hypothetical protein JG687_00012441 [Phytophthora cactorum]|uniref:Uncharacterized protein n=1 Tax=Phytophthora cactorum TaxID=29920 RepID=A0A8T1U6F5_9STRA|nr:hypothetical protein JG687_00012441 [Phytophthora cactorum]